MTKILKPYTIIPSELYVQRDADKQIKNIIEDMGRPGYVLVSRQMGKTNLLLNAKRKLESSLDAFVYIDLSNEFVDIRDCFENIIDVALDSYPEKFDSIVQTIKNRRKELVDTPPHKQHTNELRILLQALNGGKLIIILDEIDALTKTNYSDQLFSQIRSSYFASRVNYTEFYNLTYLLSGVVEPRDIIKDPKVSPFNIGQKIYLNDFSRPEFEQFILISKLSLSDEIKDRIFYWTNGNPRITWDVCSEVEDILKHTDLTIDVIDKIINNLYLTTFDKPPVDNIRELVKKDKEIRNSIIEIIYKKGNEISDRIKSKLYLSGIINYDDNDVIVKNRIIKQSLNLEWIKSIEEDEKGLVNVAIEFFEKGNFIESLNVFERYLTDNEFIFEDKSICFYYMAYAAYRNSDFEKSLKYLTQTSFDIEEERKWYFRSVNLKGLDYYYLDRTEESLVCFKQIIEKSNKDDLYVRALLNFGSLCLKSEKENYKADATIIFNEIINETGFEREKLKKEVIDELKSIAHYNLGLLQSLDANIVDAISNFNTAILLAKNNTKPAIYISLLEIITNESERKVLYDQLINLIVDDKITPIENDPEKPIAFSFDEFKNITIEVFINYRESLFHKLTPSLSVLGDKSLGEHIYELAVYSININNDWNSALKIFEDIYTNFDTESYGLNNTVKYNTLKFTAYLTDVDKTHLKHIEYISHFSEERLVAIDYFDMEIFANLIYNLISKKKYQDALKFINLIKSFKDEVPESILINYLLIYNFELNIYTYLNDRRKSINLAEEIISFASDEKIKAQNSNLLGDTGLDIIKQNAEHILHPVSKKIEPIKVGRTYGRNELVKVRYKDGTIIETKFKKVEEDLKREKCFILN